MQAGHGASRGRAADGYRAPERQLSSSDLICCRGRTANRKPGRKRLRRRADAIPGILLGDDSPAGEGGPSARRRLKLPPYLSPLLARYFRRSPDHALLMASLEDKYGSYGQLGLLLLERGPKVWTIKLLLLSCRVMSRGVNTVMLSNILSQAKAAGVQLCAELVSNDRNRMMNITYKFAGFREAGKTARGILRENDLPSIQPFPPYLTFDRASRSKQRNGYPS